MVLLLLRQLLSCFAQLPRSQSPLHGFQFLQPSSSPRSELPTRIQFVFLLLSNSYSLSLLLHVFSTELEPSSSTTASSLPSQLSSLDFFFDVRGHLSSERETTSCTLVDVWRDSTGTVEVHGRGGRVRRRRSGRGTQVRSFVRRVWHSLGVHEVFVPEGQSRSSLVLNST